MHIVYWLLIGQFYSINVFHPMLKDKHIGDISSLKCHLVIGFFKDLSIMFPFHNRLTEELMWRRRETNREELNKYENDDIDRDQLHEKQKQKGKNIVHRVMKVNLIRIQLKN